MSDAINFGKQAANAWGAAGTLAGKAFRGLTGAATSAAKPAAKAVTNAPNAAKVTISPADVAQAGRQMSAPPLPKPPTAPKITVSPAEAAAGRAKVTLTPKEIQEMSRRHAAGQGYTLPPNRAPVAVRAAQQNADAAMRARLNAGGGTPEELQTVLGPTLRENAARVAGANKVPPAVPAAPIKISPAEAAAGRAKATITPEEVAAVKSGAVGFGRKVATTNTIPNIPNPELDAYHAVRGVAPVAGLAGGGASLGAILGGLYGLASSEKGKRLGAALRGVGGGAVIGGAGGVGAALAAQSAIPNLREPSLASTLRVLAAGTPEVAKNVAHKEMYGVTPAELNQNVSRAGLMGGLGGLGLGGLGVGGLAMAGSKDDEEEKKTAMVFGRKVANHVDFYERAPKDETKKKLPDHEIFNNALMRAEAAGEKPSAELFNRIDSEYKEKSKKEAKSKCVPCDSGMYKNYDRGVYQTGPMQAMDADEAISKANGGVETTEETEHAEKDIHNSGQKSAYAFGWKVAQFNVFGPELFTGPDKPGMTPFPRQAAPATKVAPISPALRLARAAAPSMFGPETETGGQPLLKTMGDQPGDAALPGKSQNLAIRLANGLEKIMELEQQAKAKQPRRPFDDNYKPSPPPPVRKSAPAPAPASAPAPAPTSAKSFGQQAYDMLGTAGNAISSGVSAVNNARLSTGKAIGEGAYALSAISPEAWTGPAKPGMTPGYKAPKTDAPKTDAPKTDAPGAASGLAGLPWGAIAGGGLGVAGLSALAYHLMNQKKKKKKDGDDEEG